MFDQQEWDEEVKRASEENRLTRKALEKARVELYNKMVKIGREVTEGWKDPIPDHIRAQIVERWEDEKLIKHSQIVEVRIPTPPEFKTSKELRDYQKARREKIKRYKIQAQKEESLRLLVEDKLKSKNKALCFDCKAYNLLKEDKSFEIIQDKKTGRKKIIILANCGVCDANLKVWGGYYEV